MSQFVLNRATENLRDELYEYLVMMTLYDTEELTKEEIISSIEKDLDVKRLPVNIVDSALKRLLKNGDIEFIQRQGKTRYFLSPTKKEKLSRMTQEYMTVFSAVTSKLITFIEKEYGPLTDAEKTIIIKNFQMLIGTIFSVNGFECANAIIGKPRMTAKTMKSTNISELIVQILGESKGKLPEVQKKVFMDYLHEPDENLSAYLYSLAQSYFLIEILNLDPECKSLTKESMAKKTVYLDTNVIVFALIGKREEFKVMGDLIKLSTDLGVKVKFTKRTMEEFLDYIKTLKTRYGTKYQIPEKRYKKLVNVMADGFLKDYNEKRLTNPGLTYDGYFARFEQVEAILRKRYLVEVDQDPYKEIEKHADMEKVEKLVFDTALLMGNLKDIKVSQHDAYHILLVQELRRKEGGSALGPDYWFITYDKSLYHVDKELMKDRGILPSSIFVDKWTQMISPLLSPEVSDKKGREIFANLFASNIPIVTKTIREEDLVDLQGTWMDDEDLGSEDLAKIIGDKYVRDYLLKVRSAGKEINREELFGVLQLPISETKIEKRVQEKTTKVTQEITKSKKIVSSYQKVILMFWIVSCLLANVILYKVFLFSSVGLGIVVTIEIFVTSLFKEDIRNLIKKIIPR